MKTIAIVTMTFLPATFFAAVFAMPVLRWDASPVVQPNFWVYLAFSFPSTALVFAVWAVITKRHALKELFQRARPNLRKKLQVAEGKASAA